MQHKLLYSPAAAMAPRCPAEPSNSASGLAPSHSHWFQPFMSTTAASEWPRSRRRNCAKSARRACAMRMQMLEKCIEMVKWRCADCAAMHSHEGGQSHFRGGAPQQISDFFLEIFDFFSQKFRLCISKLSTVYLKTFDFISRKFWLLKFRLFFSKVSTLFLENFDFFSQRFKIYIFLLGPNALP